jgi:tRNA(Ile)-lysidine synthetase-like protein
MPPAGRAEAVLLELRRSSLVAPGERLLVGCSGGHDSTALLLALREVGCEPVAAHFDHALQPGSAQVAQQVGELCSSIGVSLITERRVEPLAAGSVQAAARSLRYEFLERAAVEAGVRHIALAHTADDLVEGAVLHLLRGCGIAGLRGMPARRGRFVRPLLHVWRRDVLAFLRSRAVAAHEDPANSNPAYARVRVRRELLPAFERDRPGITARFHAAAVRASQLQDAVAADAARAVGTGPVAREVLAGASEPVAVEMIRLLYGRAAGDQPALSRSQLLAMLRLARGDRGGQGLDLPGGLRFRIVDGHVEIAPRVADRWDGAMEVRECLGCNEPGAVHLIAGLDLTLGRRRPGLRMRPAGGAGTRKLQDIFVDAHVPREARDSWPLVFAGERLAWVPGVAVDGELLAGPGSPALHVTVTRMLLGSRKNPVLESPDHLPGEPS